ncbi:TraB/GumN family protein [Methanomassiliicoccus luminyensis]|uniref:TraB/GumN family protein n=1 Tax=Methanomassiliicoccus luminyensis TaxID=1080712 RepID=UPI00035F6032|nr:TraB/GumN family protein [Methanomassiliicoccus luminyensis]
MIVILGVGHVFDIASEVRRIIEEERPDVVGVELDPARYHALLHPGGQTNAPLTYRLLAAFQKRLAGQYGSEAGAEMLEAAKAAKDIGADLLFIDADASKLFQRMYREMPFAEKVKLGLSAFTSLFVSSKKVEKELENYQENEGTYMDQMGGQFPTLKRVLVDERNELMTKRINSAASRYPTVLAVVGDGHVDGIMRLLDRDDVRVYRLRDIREKGRGSQAKSVENNSQASFHYEY